MEERDGHIEQELIELGRGGSRWVAEPLLHNPANAVTASICRISADVFSAVLKTLAPPHETAQEHWAASDDPSHWNYWRREALVYEHDVPSLYEGSGIGAPRLLGSFARPGGEVALWLEDVYGVPGTQWTLDRHAAAVQSLGHAQGRIAAAGPVPSHEWLTRGFLRAYGASKPVDWGLLEDEEAWRQPLVRDHFPPRLRERWLELHSERERWLALLESLPRTFCHLDVWPHNLLARDAENTVLVDWAFAGDGALGEDVGNHVPDCVFDLFLPAERLPELDERAYGAYLQGLREGGWEGDERLVRLGICASAIKYDWLVPLMVGRAGEAEQLDYGAQGVVPGELRYRERGAALAFLADWADEARALARELGLDGGL
jgi:Phosphotransferase enzyme family